MSRSFNHYIEQTPADFRSDQGYRAAQKAEQEDYQLFEYLQQGYYQPPVNRFVLADGQIMEGSEHE